MTAPPPARTPTVSVLMPTYRHGWVIDRALDSLLAQECQDWELILLDDGSPDDTRTVIEPYLADPRIRYVRFERNRGLGAALNHATGIARGKYLAYLPSDDVIHPDHLSSLVTCLDEEPDAFLAYSGVRSHKHWWGWDGLTLLGSPEFEREGSHELQGVQAVGHEAAALAGRLAHSNAMALTNDNVLALVQVMHRVPPAGLRWTERSEFVSDSLEPDFWRSLLRAGLSFRCTGQVTCEWTDHPWQRHKIIAEAYERPAPLQWPPGGRGLSAYRRHYGIPAGQALDWRPTLGAVVDEGQWYAGFPTPAAATTGLRIHLVGELGFNPERIAALAAAGHRLSATWAPITETWDTAASLPVLDVEEVPWGPAAAERIRALKPDVLYALLNVQAIPLVHAMLDLDLGVPLVFHFKESPQRAMTHGLWSTLKAILRRCDGLILTSPENADWYRFAFPGLVREDRLLIMDGDLPSAHWMGEAWAPRLSDIDGEPHVACVGRTVALGRLEQVAQIGVHVHLYGGTFQYPHVLDLARRVPRIHLHPTVKPGDWVRELSRHDAGWLHDTSSSNRGDIRKASWADLNLPARLGTYAAAGLPWLVRGATPAVTSVRSLAQRLGVGVPYETVDDLVRALRHREVVGQAAAMMRENRLQLSFDSHVEQLTGFFRQVAFCGPG